MSSDGTPNIPYWTGGKAEMMHGLGDHFDLMSRLDFYFNHREDHFWGDTLQAEYPAAKTNGTSAAVTFTAGNSGGYIELVTGTDNDGYAGQAFSTPMFTGDRGLVTQFLFKTPSSLANFKMEVGVTDAADDAGAVNAKTTPTVTAADCAVLCFDTADDSNLTLIHVKAAGTAAAVENTGFTLAVSSVYYVAFRVETDDVKCIIRGLTGTQSAEFSWANAVAAAGVEGGNKLTPWVFVQARAGSASKTLTLYKWGVSWPAF